MISRRGFIQAGGALAAATAFPGLSFAQGEAILAISTASVMASPNPFAHSSAQLYSVWSQVYGTFTRYNYLTKTLEPLIAESWEAVEPNRWRIKLNAALLRHDGAPGPTAKDAIHSLQMAQNDTLSQQRHLMAQVEGLEEVDEHTLDIVTNTPFALFPSEILSRLICTSAEIYAELGDAMYADKPLGWGPYKLESFEVDNQIVLRRNEHWPNPSGKAPDVAVFRQIMEGEQRVNALLNNEIQIARLIAPQMIDRVRQPGIDVVESSGLEYMFLGMNVNHGPWGDMRVRQAVAHGVNRQLIVDRILFGLADVMDSAIGLNQDCYSPVANFPQYDPVHSRQLLAEAGHPDGLEIDFYTASGRYIADRQIGEAIAQMLGDVGFRVNLHAPDYTNFTQMVQKGECPFFYTGRGASNNSLYNLPQFFETGGSPRIGYSNPRADELFELARSEFDDDTRCEVLDELSALLVEESPALFMWTHKLVQAKRSDVFWEADANGEVWLIDVQVG